MVTHDLNRRQVKGLAVASTIGKRDDVLKSLPKKPLVLDYGADKLRNTLYLLEKGCNVRAVEFEKIQGISEHAKNV